MKTKNFFKVILLGAAVCLNTTFSFAGTWATAADGGGNDAGFATCVDGSGNVYTTGYERDNTANYIFTVKKYNSSGVLQNTYTYDGVSSTTEFEFGCAIAATTSYVWVTGAAYNDATNKMDLVLVKIAQSNMTAAAHYPKFYTDAGDVAGIGGHSLKVYDDTHVYVGGATYDGTTNGWKGIVLKDSSAATTANTWAWTKVFVGITTTVNTADALDIKYDLTRNRVYVTGYQTGSHGKDCFTDKLNANSGLAQTGWPKTYNGGSNGDDVSNALYFDEAYDRVYIAGYTTTANGTDAWIDSYTAAGGARTGFPATYDGANHLDDKFTDIDGTGSACSTGLIYAGGFTTVGTGGSHDENYLIESFDTTNAGITCWGTNPIIYDGGGAAPEATGADEGYGITYDANYDIITINGRSDETTTGLAITALQYSGTTGYVGGTYTWKGTYDYGSNTIQTGENQEWYKYGLFTVTNGCYMWDFVYEASDYYNGTTYDMLTQEYFSTGACLRMIDPNLLTQSSQSSKQPGFYPNPFSSSATLELSPETKIDNAILKIYDMTGREVSVIENIHSNSIVVEKGKMTNGIYFYRLFDNGEMLCNGKFVIAE